MNYEYALGLQKANPMFFLDSGRLDFRNSFQCFFSTSAVCGSKSRVLKVFSELVGYIGRFGYV